MKALIQKVTRLLLATLMFFTSLSINNMVVYAEDEPVKELKAGETYYIGETMVVLNVEPAYIKTDDDNPFKIFDSYHDYGEPARFTVPTPVYESEHGWYRFDDMFVNESYDSVSLCLKSEELEESVTGIKCVSGDGTLSNPYAFELVTSTPTNPTVIDVVECTITSPIAGVEVSGDWDTQNPRPEISVHGSNYYIDESETYWLNEDLTLFEGEFVENEYYYFGVLLRTEYGYEFVGNSSDLTVNITNGEFVKFANYQSTRLAIVGKVKCKAAPQTKELKVGEEFLIGDTIKLSKHTFINTDDEPQIFNVHQIISGEVLLNNPTYITEYGQFMFENLFKDVYGYNKSLYLGYGANLTGDETVKGIKCISGDGTEQNPFVFELMFETTNTHKVTFVLNGGEMSPSEVYVEDGEYLKSYEYEPTRLGQYNFEGWYTDSGCQNEFRWWETPIESALTLYAKWSEYYVINYDFGGGVLWDETSSTFNYPKEWDRTETIPSIEEMEEWNYQAPVGTRYAGVNVNGKQYLPGEEVKITGNTTVTLINLPIDKNILTFKLDGGKLGDQEGVAFFPYDNGTKISLPKPTKSGYTFDYWEGSKHYAGEAYTVNGDHTFKAIWKSPSPVKPIVPVIVPVPNTGVK